MSELFGGSGGGGGDVAAHEAAGNPHPAYTTDAEATALAEAEVVAHEAAADPHAGYRLESADHTHASTGLQGGILANNIVTDAILRDSAAVSVIGRSANSSGDPADIAASADGQMLQRLSSALSWSNIGYTNVSRTTSDQTATSDTALDNVIGLSFSIAANHIYAGMIVIYYDGATGGDIKLDLTIPTDATYRIGTQGLDSAVTSAAGNLRSASSATIGGTSSRGAAGATVVVMLTQWFLIVNDANAGTVQVRFAQATSDGTATTIFANSHIIYWRVA